MDQYQDDCLIVLDTLGTRTDAAILGITCLRFNLERPAEAITKFEAAISADSNRSAGRTFDDGGLKHWADRPDMIDVFSRDGGDLLDSLFALSDFYDGSNTLWASGGNFEPALLTTAYEHFGLAPPWPYWAAMCGRTIGALGAWIQDKQVPAGVSADTSLETARIRLALLRTAYATVGAAAIRRKTLEREVA